MSTHLSTDIVATLTNDGDSYTLPDGRTLHLHIGHDDLDAIDEINGVDCYGRVAWPVRDRYNYDYRHDAYGARPAEFTGRAIKLSLYGGDSIWWEPYYEGGPYTPPSRAERSFMADLLSFGFMEVALDLRENVTDSRGNDHDVTVASASLCGIDTIDSYPDGFDGPIVWHGYLRDILSDLLSELDIDVA